MMRPNSTFSHPVAIYSMKNLTCCPVCESENIVFKYNGRSNRDAVDPAVWPVFNCEGCSHGFMNPQPSWDDLQPYYNASYEPYSGDHGFEQIDRDVAEAKRSGELRHIKVTPGMRLLDVGCGGGSFLRRAAALGAAVQGVEPSADGVAAASSAEFPVFHGEIDSFIDSHPGAKFEVVTSNHVVEHHPAPVEMLKDMAKVLSEDGYIWMSVPNAGCKSSQRLDWRWHSSDLPFHLMQFNPDSVREMLSRANLKIRRIYTYTFPPAGLASMCAELRYRYCVPRKLTERLPLLSYATRRARRMDQRMEGEAIIVEATL